MTFQRLLIPALTAVLAAAAAADPLVVIVPRDQTRASIPADWLATITDGATVRSFTKTVRGSLQRTADDGFLYRPDSSFWELGSDSFRHDAGSPVPHLHAVYLVADLRETPVTAGAAFEPPSCALDPRWIVVGPPKIATTGATPGCVAEFLPGPSPSYLAIRTGQSGPGGGNTALALDPGGGGLGEGGSVPIVAGVLETGETVFEILLASDGLLARGRNSDGSYGSSDLVALDDGWRSLGLTWWFASEDGAADGGLFLTVDSQLRGQVLGLDNFDFVGFDWEWRFGQPSAGSIQSGNLLLAAPRVWTSARRPVFEPVFADTGEPRSLATWSARLGEEHMAVAEPAGADPEIRITIPSDDTAALIDRSPAGARHYRARFELRIEDLVLDDGSAFTVFSGLGSSSQAVEPFVLEIRRAVAGVELRASGTHGLGRRFSPWLPFASAGAVEIEVQWWSGAGVSPAGGLRLWIDREPAAYLKLENAGSRVSETRLGAIATPYLAAGTLIVDDFEAWR